MLFPNITDVLKDMFLCFCSCVIVVAVFVLFWGRVFVAFFFVAFFLGGLGFWGFLFLFC